MPKVLKKHKEKTLDASLFDDNIDIFADLTDTLIPKQKSKTKVETKSIFDDDMGKHASIHVFCNFVLCYFLNLCLTGCFVHVFIL